MSIALLHVDKSTPSTLPSSVTRKYGSSPLTGWKDNHESLLHSFPIKNDKKDSIQNLSDHLKRSRERVNSAKAIPVGLEVTRSQLKLDQIDPILKIPSIATSNANDKISLGFENQLKLKRRPQSQTLLRDHSANEILQTIKETKNNEIVSVLRNTEKSEIKPIVQVPLVYTKRRPINCRLVNLDSQAAKLGTTYFPYRPEQKKIYKKRAQSLESPPILIEREERGINNQEGSSINIGRKETSREAFRGSLRVLTNKKFNLVRKTTLGISRLVNNDDLQAENNLSSYFIPGYQLISARESLCQQEQQNGKANDTSKLKLHPNRINESKQNKRDRSFKINLFPLKSCLYDLEAAKFSETVRILMKRLEGEKSEQIVQETTSNSKLKVEKTQSQPKVLQRKI